LPLYQANWHFAIPFYLKRERSRGKVVNTTSQNQAKHFLAKPQSAQRKAGTSLMKTLSPFVLLFLAAFAALRETRFISFHHIILSI
jgi:hypothetical protein